MSWRAVSAVLVVVFAVAIVQSVLAGPLVQFATALSDTGTYGFAGLDGNDYIMDLPSTWFNMGLVAIFGVMLWGA